ncbi:hypothetical protein [Sagittula stellata]|uniref:Uncharacterized protein n=1 Tax=Sagittula stellata (strain ATCC 700073 / DSM 11524 / E-37) TaxID=388399 RepID=A3K182_SAGS3|nr:hypothetical protein [Sagittula stellata]EBA08678.1 hypothetical protein SSE37_03510 [Sagittula stellata E-37]
MSWPQTIPADLRRDLDTLETMRDPQTSQDRWGFIRVWLIRHGIEAPEYLPVEPERRPEMDQ